jgi:hypothetical protein
LFGRLGPSLSRKVLPMGCHVTEVDGVTTFWADSDRPTLAASLLFRQGQADETLPTSGWTHLLEHLALHGRDSVHLDINGSVGLLVTSFDAHGEPDDVARHLTEVTRWLCQPDLERLEHEAGILQADSAQRPRGPLATALLWRYGAQGPGLCGFIEPGLGRVNAASLDALVGRVFTTGNAVLCLDGPPPRGLSLDLPFGELRATYTPRPCDDPLPKRAAYATQTHDLCISGVVTRSASATALGRIMQRRLKDLLRDQEGVSYAPWHSYEAVDGGQAVLAAGADLAHDAGDQWLAAVVDLTEALARHGPTAQEVEDDTDRMVRELRDPRRTPTEPWLLAHAHLLGEQPRTLADLEAEAREVSPESVTAAAAEFHGTAMLGVPPDAPQQRRPVHWLQQPSQTPLSGRSYRAMDYPVDRSHIILADCGVQAAHGDARRGVMFNDLAGVLAFPDGGRTVISRDAYHLVIEPTLWRDGAQLVADLDGLVPQELHIPQPKRPAETIPRPQSTRRQRLNARFQSPRIYLPLFLLAVAGLILWAATDPDVYQGLLRAAPIGLTIAAITAYKTRATRPSNPEGKD